MADAGDIFSLPKDIIFPDELNRYLKDQITVFVQENAMLRRNLDDSERNLADYRKRVETLEVKMKEAENPLLPKFVPSSQTANAKVVELSKNYREKCAELEKYKSKCSKLLARIEELTRSDKNVVVPRELNNDNVPDKSEESQVKQLQEKLNQTTNKMFELKNANLQLKNALKQANKLLQQEVGEDVNSIRNGGNSWRGRAELICELQEKNKKLKEKLKQLQNPGAAEREQAPNQSNKLASLDKENVVLKGQIEVQKTKIDSLKARNAMLEMDVHDFKAKLQFLNERKKNDLQTIAELTSQVNDAENIRKILAKEKDSAILKLKSELSNLQSQIDGYRTLIDKLKAPKAETSELPQEHIERLVKEKSSLLELVKNQKDTLKKERDESDKIKQLLHLEKQKSLKLEAAMVKSQLESGLTSRSGYTSISQTSRVSIEDLRNKLELAEENVKTLQTRLQLEQEERKRDFRQFSKILSTTNLREK